MLSDRPPERGNGFLEPLHVRGCHAGGYRQKLREQRVGLRVGLIEEGRGGGLRILLEGGDNRVGRLSDLRKYARRDEFGVCGEQGRLCVLADAD